MRTSFHVVVIEEAGPSMALAFLAVFLAFPLGVVVALHGLDAPLSAINSFLQQGIDFLFQICASLLTLLFRIITFAIQVSLNLLKSIITSSFRPLASGIGELAGNFCTKFADEFKAAINDLIEKRITRFLKDSINSAASFMLSLLKRRFSESIDSLSSLIRDRLVELCGQITSSGMDINDTVASFINDPLKSIASRIAHALIGRAASLFRNSVSSIAELAEDSSKKLVKRIVKLLERWMVMVERAEKFVSMALRVVSFMRSTVPGFDVAVATATVLVPAWYFELIRCISSVWDAVIAVRPVVRELTEVLELEEF